MIYKEVGTNYLSLEHYQKIGRCREILREKYIKTEKFENI